MQPLGADKEGARREEEERSWEAFTGGALGELNLGAAA